MSNSAQVTKPVATNGKGRYPDVFICGAARCGTTFLWSALAAHPGVFMSSPKEPHFFAADLDTGSVGEGSFRVRDPSDYLALFRRASPDQLVGEASTSTLISHDAVPAILAVSPQARFIVSIRDPIEAIASRHALLRGAGFENLSLTDALRADDDRALGKRRAPRPTFPWSFPYVGGASYGEHLSRLFDVVQRERVLVMLLDEIAANRQAALTRVTEFLGLRPLEGDVEAERNANRVQQSRLLFDAVYSPATVSIAKRLVPAWAHARARRLANSFNRAMRPSAARGPLDPQLRDQLRAQLHDDVVLASRLLGDDLVARWWGAGPR